MDDMAVPILVPSLDTLTMANPGLNMDNLILGKGAVDSQAIVSQAVGREGFLILTKEVGLE